MQYQTKEELVADFLREGIISGRFPRGSKLKQVELAEMLGTSITPVREAMKLLEAEGFIDGNSHRGAIVAPLDIHATEEIVDLRVTLECKLALKALPLLNAEAIDELRKLQSQIEEASAKGDRQAVRVINYRFHERIYIAADLPLTLKFVRTLWARYPFDLINRLENRIGRARDEHQDMMQAILARDEAALITSLRVHIRSGWDEFKLSYKSS